ncbi:twin-arginine translocase TatA/TatE family subunit [Deinococcus apachensis]|uniref:twin-arginine translocase TatA/TatE family subunit n=1 Tax=Deinococcus apachensis TaxID=309886 RepID=UPI000382AE69|nr:twin-arginine translocase TatA/TatE family subunit [Deinococcus apachensis]
MSLGPLEIILIVAVIALIFGARKLPELGKGLGQGIKEYKKEVRDPAVTDVEARPLDPVTPEVPRTADGRPAPTVTERDHRA